MRNTFACRIFGAAFGKYFILSDASSFNCNNKIKKKNAHHNNWNKTREEKKVPFKFRYILQWKQGGYGIFRTCSGKTYEKKRVLNTLKRYFDFSIQRHCSPWHHNTMKYLFYFSTTGCRITKKYIQAKHSENNSMKKKWNKIKSL